MLESPAWFLSMGYGTKAQDTKIIVSIKENAPPEYANEDMIWEQVQQAGHDFLRWQFLSFVSIPPCGVTDGLVNDIFWVTLTCVKAKQMVNLTVWLVCLTEPHIKTLIEEITAHSWAIVIIATQHETLLLGHVWSALNGPWFICLAQREHQPHSDVDQRSGLWSAWKLHYFYFFFHISLW